VIPLGSDQPFEVNVSRKDKGKSLRDYSEAKIENLLSRLSPGFDLPSNTFYNKKAMKDLAVNEREFIFLTFC